MRTLFVIGLVQFVCIYTSRAQRVAPGVPPQTYQQQPQYQQQQYQQPQYQQQQQFQQTQQVPVQHQQVPMQQQQVPMQQQQVPVQQQQVPIQQQQVPIQQQQVPVQQQQQVPMQQNAHHGHHGVPQPGQVLNAANIAHEKEHIAEHLEVPMDTSKMTEQELQFHYFKMHDADNNNKLDGCELIKSLIHWHDNEETEAYTDKQLSEIVDHVINTMDKNEDGFVDYSEYKLKDNTDP